MYISINENKKGEELIKSPVSKKKCKFVRTIEIK